MPPKNNKPAGARKGRNFEPRYGEKKTSFHDRHHARPAAGRDDARGAGRGERSDASERRAPASFDRRPGSRSPNHRGFRPEAAEGAPKQRWSAQERAGRDESRGIRNRAVDGRREAPHHRSREEGADRGRYSERPRFNTDRPRSNDDRPRRDFGDDRGRRSFDGARPARDDRGAERPRYNGAGERPRYNSAGERPRGNGGDRPRYNDERPRFNNENPRRSFDNARPSRDDRGAERPRYNSAGERPRYNNSDERPRRDGFAGRPNRDERPARDDRFSRGSDTRGAERPRFNSDRPRNDDRPRRDFNEDRPRRSFDGERPQGNAARTERPRFNDDRPRRDGYAGRPSREERPRREERPSRDDWNKTAKPAQQLDDVVHDRLEAKAVAAVEVEGVTFGDLGLGANIVEVLTGMGAVSPFPIQAASIPATLEGRDVLARGRTGSGKTIAFGAPLVERVLQSQAGKRREFGRKPRAIILAPTRELALQLDGAIQPIARSVGLFTTQIYGGVPQGRQVGALMKGVDIVIGTPGRIEDLIKQGKLDLSDCRIAVLDEADHMCELGFVEPVQRILRHTADGSQKLLFSATLDREVAALVDEFLVDPAVFEVAGEDQDSGTIEHRVLVIEHREKADILTSLVDREGQTLVFARTRAYAEMLTEQFEDAGISAVALHGDLNQARRTRNLQRLTSGRAQVLVATDVAARGIHVDDIDLVVQADAPDEYKTYLHRAGRTGRAGRSGRVVTLITRQRQRRMTELLDRAEIDAPFENARAGDDLIDEITGRAMTTEELTR